MTKVKITNSCEFKNVTNGLSVIDKVINIQTSLIILDEILLSFKTISHEVKFNSKTEAGSTSKKDLSADLNGKLSDIDIAIKGLIMEYATVYRDLQTSLGLGPANPSELLLSREENNFDA